MKTRAAKKEFEKRENLPIVILVLSTALTLLSVSLIQHCDWSNRRVSVVGWLEAEGVESDTRFTSHRYVLYTEKDRYVIQGEALEDGLAEHTNERLKVKGTARTDESGERFIVVTEYKRIH